MPGTNQQNSHNQLLRRYLLGDLSESQQELTEQLYFTQDDYLDQLLVAENQLIEDYLTARLTAAEAKQSESNYLTTPEKRLRVELIGRIQRQANHPLTAQVDLLSDGAQVEKTPWWQALAAVFFSNTAARYGLVLATLIIFVGCVLLVNSIATMRPQLSRSKHCNEVSWA